MDAAQQARQAERFRTMHRAPPLLLLPNAWDALSARIFATAGFAAIATTSGGVSWAIGYADGEAAPWDEVVAATRRIVRAVTIPVTADIEAGFGDTPEAVGRSVDDIIAAGAVGINLEDGTPQAAAPIRTIADAAARIRTARAAAQTAGVPIVINARTDLWLRNLGDPARRFDDAIERGRAYLAAGADCFYPIGLRDPETIRRLARTLAAPINVNIRAGSPSVDELEALGVARASTASQVALVAATAIREAALDIKATGRFDRLNPAMTQADAQALFAAGPAP
jgi:2-methylisocitrate lyase-like PEP mutase family enzyme